MVVPSAGPLLRDGTALGRSEIGIDRVAGAQFRGADPDAVPACLDLIHQPVDVQFRESMQPADADWSLPDAIWRLQTPIVVTTNYDHVLGWGKPESRRLLNDQPEELAELYRATDVEL